MSALSTPGPIDVPGKKHWNLVVIDGSVPEPEFLAMIDESYRLVVGGLTRKQRDALNAMEKTQ